MMPGQTIANRFSGNERVQLFTIIIVCLNRIPDPLLDSIRPIVNIANGLFLRNTDASLPCDSAIKSIVGVRAEMPAWLQFHIRLKFFTNFIAPIDRAKIMKILFVKIF